MCDSGQFNYHLPKLNGQVVESTGAGYRLHSFGLQFVETIIAGTGDEASLSSTEIPLRNRTNDFDQARETLKLVRDAGEELLSTDPIRVRVTARCGGEKLTLVFDEQQHAAESPVGS